MQGGTQKKELNMAKTAFYDYFELTLFIEQVGAIAQSGPNDVAVAKVLQDDNIIIQLAKISDESLIKVLIEYGCWDDIELQNRSENEARIVWIAAWDIFDSLED